MFGVKKTRMVWLKNIEDMLIRFDRIQKRGGWTDGRTPCGGDSIGRVYVQHRAAQFTSSVTVSENIANGITKIGYVPKRSSHFRPQ